jgi:hypothetical protein
MAEFFRFLSFLSFYFLFLIFLKYQKTQVLKSSIIFPPLWYYRGYSQSTISSEHLTLTLHILSPPFYPHLSPITRIIPLPVFIPLTNSPIPHFFFKNTLQGFQGCKNHHAFLQNKPPRCLPR